MMLRKPAGAALALSCGQPQCPAPSWTSSTPSPPPTTRHTHHVNSTSRCLRRPSYNPSGRCFQRSFATIPDTNEPRSPRSPNDAASEDSPPPPWPTTIHPTPYDIFAIRRDAPYTKKRFYQLVKLYHPDLHSSTTVAPISPTVRLERYRLVVAANTLLSDPAKRHLYDRHGLGWSLTPDPSSRSSLRRADRAWRDQPGSAAHNATWEDWERWHDAREAAATGRQRQDTVHMPNGVFAILVAMACMVGAVAQGGRAEAAGAQYIETMDRQHAAIGENVRRSTQASAGLSQDQRVDRFLRDRENVAYQYMPTRYEGVPPSAEHLQQQKREQR